MSLTKIKPLLSFLSQGLFSAYGRRNAVVFAHQTQILHKLVTEIKRDSVLVSVWTLPFCWEANLEMCEKRNVEITSWKKKYIIFAF